MQTTLIHLVVDDTATVKPDLSELFGCLDAIQNWASTAKLKLNPDRIDFNLIGLAARKPEKKTQKTFNPFSKLLYFLRHAGS